MRMRNPKILVLLRKGCSITFPSGIIFSKVDNFIETGIRGGGKGKDMNDYQSIDEYSLNEEGLEEALKYEEFYADSLKDEEVEYKEEEEWQ